MPAIISTQAINYRTSQAQFLDETGQPIDLTGSTGVLVASPVNGEVDPVETAMILGKWDDPGNQAEDAENGWCYAINTELSVSGAWQEQFQLELPVGDEPLYGIVFDFTVEGNLTPP
jgi:hypothetical protein